MHRPCQDKRLSGVLVYLFPLPIAVHRPLAHGGQVLLFLNGGSIELSSVSFPLSLLSKFMVEEVVSEVTCRDLWLHAPCTGGGTLSLSGTVAHTSDLGHAYFTPFGV